jgi:hypothetical protein
MKILVACEESQAVTKELRRLGHEAYSCDIIDQSGGHPEWHIMQDVIPLLNGNCSFYTTEGVKHTIKGKWDMIIGFPPCTFMSKAGARWMYPKAGVVDPDRLKKAMEAKMFFLMILSADCPRIVVENPVPLKIVGLPPWTQKIQPYEYGHPFSKATCLWIRGNLPKLRPTKIIDNFTPFLPSNTGGFSRGEGGSRGTAHDAKTAAKTFPGVAKAIAEQMAGRDDKEGTP